MPRPQRASPERLDVLDGFRAVAILSVLVFHYTVRWTAPLDPADHFRAGAMFGAFAPLRYGWIGVELFFVISGFVILLTLERCRGPVDFLVRRFARLWPPIVLAATITALILNAVGPQDWHASGLDWLLSITFVPPPLVGRLLQHPELHWVDGSYWSLWCEVRFYALALAVQVVAKERFLLAIFGLLAAGLVLEHSDLPHARAIADAALFIDYLPYFALGCCLYAARCAAPRRDAVAIGGGVFASLVILTRAATVFLPSQAQPGGSVLANAVVLALVWAFVLRGRWVTAFSARPLVAIGRASYSLYLLHQSLGVLLLIELTRVGVNPPVAVTVVTLAMVMAALASHRWFEVPAQAWILRRWRGTEDPGDGRTPGNGLRPFPQRSIIRSQSG